ncbi:MAG: BtrH N-terminal domain-containing protein [Myxococcota bacterium]
MKTLIGDYQNLPGEHCASSAMQSLLRFYCDTDLPEDVIFGLGSGPDCIYIASEKMDPQIAMFGRTATLEVDLTDALGIDYRETIEPDGQKAWEIVRGEVLEGRPTMLTGDVFYLDYRKFKVHFPGHRFVLVGFDDEARIAWVADRVDEKPQACSFDALAKSRNPPIGVQLYNLWGKFHGTTLAHPLEEACVRALRKNADRMLGTDTFQSDFLKSGIPDETLVAVSGLAGLEMFSREIPAWQARGDAAFLASYLSQTIEKFGTGGGNFRILYTGFLRWAHALLPDRVPVALPELSARAAKDWTALSATLRQASETPEDPAPWQLAGRQAQGIHAVETELFEKMDAGLAKA